MMETRIFAKVRQDGMRYIAVWLLLFGVMTSAQASTSAQAVEITNMAFSPGDLTVKPGTKVTWTNQDQVPHTVTSKDKGGALSSQGLDTDDSYSYTFTRAGDYAYYCTVHPFMMGVVHVRK